VTGRLLVIAFLLLLVGKVFYRPQLAAIKKWFDGVINAMLIAIALVYFVHMSIWFFF